MTKPNTPSSGSTTKKWWRVGAIALLVGMVLGKVIYNATAENDYTVAPINDQQPDDGQLSPYKTIDDRFSTGDRAIVQSESDYIPCKEDQKASLNQAKSSGTRMMRKQQYETAAQFFETAWSLCPAPEVLIYKNNALIGNNPAHTVAIAVPIAWPNPKNALEMLRGAAQAQTEINQSGGVNGVPIKLMIIDDSDKPEVAKNIATTLIDSYPEVLAVVGHWTSGVSLEAATVYDARRALVFMTPVSTTRELKGETGWVFRSTINMRDAQKVLAQHAFSELGYSRVATFSLAASKVGEARALYSEGLQDEFAKSFEQTGGDITNNFNLASLDFETKREATARKMVRQAKKEGADAVMLIPDNSLVDNAEAIIEEANKQGLGLLGVTNLYRDEVLQETCPAVEGLTMTIAWIADGSANPDFVKSSSSSQFWKGEVNFATAMTYNAVQAIATAMEKDPTRDGIQSALNLDDFKVIKTADSQPMTFQQRSRSAVAQLVTVEKTKDSSERNKWRCDFFPTKETRVSISIPLPTN